MNLEWQEYPSYHYMIPEMADIEGEIYVEWTRISQWQWMFFANRYDRQEHPLFREGMDFPSAEAAIKDAEAKLEDYLKTERE